VLLNPGDTQSSSRQTPRPRNNQTLSICEVRACLSISTGNWDLDMDLRRAALPAQHEADSINFPNNHNGEDISRGQSLTRSSDICRGRGIWTIQR